MATEDPNPRVPRGTSAGRSAVTRRPRTPPAATANEAIAADESGSAAPLAAKSSAVPRPRSTSTRTRVTTSHSASTSPRTRTATVAIPEPLSAPAVAEAVMEAVAVSVVEPVVVPVMVPVAAPVHDSHTDSPFDSILSGTTTVDDGPAITEFAPPSRPSPTASSAEPALSVRGLRKRYGRVVAVDGVDLEIPSGSFYGFVGPNGAGKTTTLSMITGLVRPDGGVARVYGYDVWKARASAARVLGVLPDHLRLFDRLTGAQLLHYAGALRGLDRATIATRSRDLATAFGLTASLGRPVTDYSVGMAKKIAIAAALIHAPRMLVLDEPFESVDPVSSAAVLRILRRFTAAGGTVLLSSHNMELIETTCDALAIIVAGRVLAAGPISEVLAGLSLEDRFVELAGGSSAVEGMEWLHSFSD